MHFAQWDPEQIALVARAYVPAGCLGREDEDHDTRYRSIGQGVCLAEPAIDVDHAGQPQVMDPQALLLEDLARGRDDYILTRLDVATHGERAYNY